MVNYNTIREVHRNNINKAYADKLWQKYVEGLDGRK